MGIVKIMFQYLQNKKRLKLRSRANLIKLVLYHYQHQVLQTNTAGLKYILIILLTNIAWQITIWLSIRIDDILYILNK